QQVAHSVTDAIGLARVAFPAVLEHYVKLRLGGFLDESASRALAGPVLRGRARDPVVHGPEAEFERDLRAQGRIGVGAAHVLRIALSARRIAIECEADGIEQRGLARARGPVDQEERLLAEPREIDGLGGCEWS